MSLVVRNPVDLSHMNRVTICLSALEHSGMVTAITLDRMTGSSRGSRERSHVNVTACNTFRARGVALESNGYITLMFGPAPKLIWRPERLGVPT